MLLDHKQKKMKVLHLTFDMRTALIFFTVIAVIVLLSYGLAKLTEFHTHKVYKKLGI